MVRVEFTGGFVERVEFVDGLRGGVVVRVSCGGGGFNGGEVKRSKSGGVVVVGTMI